MMWVPGPFQGRRAARVPEEGQREFLRPDPRGTDPETAEMQDGSREGETEY